MTLQQYDKQLLEKRKALEAFKKEERKVTVDEELDSMQLVGKKKDDVASAKQVGIQKKLSIYVFILLALFFLSVSTTM